MRKAFVVLLFVILVAAGTTTWGQCPTEFDNGVCDTLAVETYGFQGVSPTGFVSVQLLVTHDQTVPLDSIAGFIIPLSYTSTNQSTYCSLSSYWNGTTIISVDPAAARSVFRHLPSISDPQVHNRMMDLNSDFQSGWDFIFLYLGSEEANTSSDSGAVFWLNLVPTGSVDQRWGDGERVLLATMTFKIGDTTTICIDSTFWPPSSRLAYYNADADGYIPKHYLPYCFAITAVDVREVHGSEESRPSDFSLAQNYPNPFNPYTNIRFDVSKPAHVKLEVFNIVGQKVKTLVDDKMKAGTYVADWNGQDDNGKMVSSGIYFYRMQADEFSDMKKMLLVK